MAENSWLTASPVSGSGDLSVSVGGSLWTGRLDRSGQLTVSGVTFPDLSCVLNCTQAGSVILESIGESSATVGALVEGYVALQGVSIRSNLASLAFSFVGSDGDSAWVSGIRYSVDGGDTMLDSGASIPGDPGATGAYTAAVYVSVAEETSGVSRSGVLTVSGSGQTLEFTVSQSAGVKTYGPVEILSLTAADVPASGGSVTSGSVIYQQTYGWNGATSGAGTITSGGSVSWSGGASGIGSLGTTVKDRSVVGSPLVVTVALNDQVGSSSVDIYQAANVSTLTGISADTLSYDAIPVLGGSSSPYYSISGSYSYTSGSTSTSVIDSVVRSRMRAATAATKSFAFVAPVAGFTIDSGTGVVSATETEQTSEKVAQVKMSVAYEGFSSSVTGTCLQPAGSVVYGTPTIALSYATAPAGGGTLSPVFSVTQPWGWNNDTEAGVLSYDLESLPDGSSVNFTTTAGTVGSEDGSITVPTKGMTESGVTTYATITCDVTVNGVSGSGTAAVSQAANTRALTGVSIERNGSGALVTSFTAAGGTAYYKPVGVFTYTSTSTQTIELDSEVTEDSWSLDQAWGSVAASPTYPWCSVVTINSRGTVIGNSRSAVLKLTVGGLSDSVVLTQEANSRTLNSIRIDKHQFDDSWVGVDQWGNLSPAGGEALGILGYRVYDYTSGSSSESRIIGESPIVNIDVDWVKTYPTTVAEGCVQTATRGNQIGNVRSGNVSWTVDGLTSNSLSFTQAENTITSVEILNAEDASAPVISVLASKSVYGYTLRCYYSSGSTGSSVLPQSIINWSFDQTWGSPRDNEGSDRYYTYIEFSSRGTTIGSERSGSLICTINGVVNDVSINKTASLTITQEANNVERVAITTGGGIDNPYPTEFSAAGDAYVAAAWAYYTSNAKQEIQDATFDNWSISGSGFQMTSDPNYKYAVDISAENRGTIVGPERSATISFEYSGTSDSITLTQEANEQKQTACSIEIDHDFQDPLGYNNTNVPAAGGRVCIIGVRHYSYTSGSTSQTEYDSFTLSSDQSWCVSDDASNLTISSRGTVTGSDRSATVYWQDGSFKSNEMTITQKANQEASYSIYGGVESKTPTGGVNDWMSAGGGTFTFFTQLKVTYSSGSTEERSVTQNTEYVMDSGGYATVTGNKATIPGRGITIENARYCGFTQRYSIGGKTYTSWFNTAQNGNYVESIKGSVGTFSYPTIGAGATSATPDLSAGFGILFTFSSGSTSSSAPASTYGTLSVPSSFKLSASQNGFTAVNASTGVLTATNRGTTIGEARTSGTVTRTLTATWTPTSSYNTAGTKTSTWSTTATCTQAANTLTWNTPTISRTTPVTIAAAGGTDNVATGLTYSQTGQYSSGSPASANSGGTLSYAVKTAKTGFSLSGSTVTATNNTSTSARNGFVVTITLKLNDKTTTKDITYNQAAGYFTYANPVINATYPTIPASGGTVTPTVSYSQTYGWNGATSGAGTDTTGGSISYAGSSVNTSNGSVTAGSKGAVASGVTDVTTATITVTMHGKRSDKQVKVQQAANSLKSYSNVLINQFGYNNIQYSGGTSSPAMDITYDVTYDSGTYRDEHGLPSGYSRTFTISGSGFSINASSGVVTAQANTATNTRSATVTATIKNSSGAAVTSATAKVTQAAKPGPVDIYITTSFDYASSQIKINFSTGPKDTFFIKFMGYDQFGSIWEGVTGFNPSSETSFTYAPSGYSITDQFNIEGIGSSEYTISPSSPYETSNARYYWQSTFRFKS